MCVGKPINYLMEKSLISNNSSYTSYTRIGFRKILGFGKALTDIHKIDKHSLDNEYMLIKLVYFILVLNLFANYITIYISQHKYILDDVIVYMMKYHTERT